LLLIGLVLTPLWAGPKELKTVEASAAVVRELSAIPARGIPHVLLHDAAGVAVIPHVVKAGLVIDVKSGHGVVLAHEPDGRWSNPVFVTLKGTGVGGQAGVEATDLVLVFKTKKALDRALLGKLTLGGDVTVAAGPVGREAEAGRDGLFRAEVYTYSRSRGLFVGVSLEGARLHVDAKANEGCYGLRGGRPVDVLAHRGPPVPPVEALKAQLAALSGPAAPVLIVPAGGPPRPLPPPR
jgi:lipid-binding SYLF domain-containing protein